MNSQTTSVLYSLEGALARITLNRPEKRNALNSELVAGIKAALRVAVDANDTRVIIITGAGTDFCSGADLASLRKISEASVTENADDAHSLLDLFVLIRQLPVPVIAAVQGRALAGGCGLATACDLVLASSSARFGYPEVKLGFVPAMVLSILRRNISEKRAFELITLGREFGAQEAKEFGLVNEVLSNETFAEGVTAYAKKFEATSKSAVALTKNLFYQIDGLAFLEALDSGADVNVIARMTGDCQKGIARFLSKK
jgi:methylglutaconyl-CoA hydratase